MRSRAKIYGHSAVLDIVDCDPATFTRPNIEAFLVVLCGAIEMEREDLHFWDYDRDPEGYDAAPAHLRGVSAVQFIKTSSIVVHTLDELRAVFIDLFSCKSFDPADAHRVASDHFKGRVRACRFVTRGY